jgi:hypothetical protein
MASNESPTNQWAYPDLTEQVLLRHINKSSLILKSNNKEISEDDYKKLITIIIERNKRSLSGKIGDYHTSKFTLDSIKKLKESIKDAYFELRGLMNTEQGRLNKTRALKNKFERNKRSASRRRRELSERRRRNSGKSSRNRTPH